MELTTLAERFKNEHELQTNITHYLLRNGWFVIRINAVMQSIAGQFLRNNYISGSESMNGNEPVANGIPHLLAMHPYHPTMFIECNFDGNTLFKHQKKFADYSNSKHLKVIVANNLQIFIHWYEITFKRNN